MTQKHLLISFLIFLTNPCIPGLASELSQPSSTTDFDHGPRVPSTADEMPQSRLKTIASEISKITILRDQSLNNDHQEGKQKSWTNQQEANGKYAETTINFYDDGKISNYSVWLRWRRGWLSKTYLYDKNGKLRLASFGELLGEFLSGDFRNQEIFFDEKGKVLEVVYYGNFEENGKVSRQNKILKQPLKLEDGSDLDFISDPKLIINKAPLESITSKPGIRKTYPFIGVAYGSYGGAYLLGGYNLERMGFEVETTFWNPQNVDFLGKLTFRFMGNDEGSLRNDFTYVFGVGNESSAGYPAHFYSGFGVNFRLGRLIMEEDLVNNNFWNFQDNHWQGLFRIGIVQAFN
jgi:hypothetical protein